MLKSGGQWLIVPSFGTKKRLLVTFPIAQLPSINGRNPDSSLRSE
jgi:hypothetical protein